MVLQSEAGAFLRAIGVEIGQNRAAVIGDLFYFVQPAFIVEGIDSFVVTIRRLVSNRVDVRCQYRESGSGERGQERGGFFAKIGNCAAVVFFDFCHRRLCGLCHLVPVALDDRAVSVNRSVWSLPKFSHVFEFFVKFFSLFNCRGKVKSKFGCVVEQFCKAEFVRFAQLFPADGDDSQAASKAEKASAKRFPVKVFEIGAGSPAVAIFCTVKPHAGEKDTQADHKDDAKGGVPTIYALDGHLMIHRFQFGPSSGRGMAVSCSSRAGPGSKQRLNSLEVVSLFLKFLNDAVHVPSRRGSVSEHRVAQHRVHEGQLFPNHISAFFKRGSAKVGVWKCVDRIAMLAVCCNGQGHHAAFQSGAVHQRYECSEIYCDLIAGALKCRQIIGQGFYVGWYVRVSKQSAVFFVGVKFSGALKSCKYFKCGAQFINRIVALDQCPGGHCFQMSDVSFAGFNNAQLLHLVLPANGNNCERPAANAEKASKYRFPLDAVKLFAVQGAAQKADDCSAGNGNSARPAVKFFQLVSSPRRFQGCSGLCCRRGLGAMMTIGGVLGKIINRIGQSGIVGDLAEIVFEICAQPNKTTSVVLKLGRQWFKFHFGKRNYTGSCGSVHVGKFELDSVDADIRYVIWHGNVKIGVNCSFLVLQGGVGWKFENAVLNGRHRNLVDFRYRGFDVVRHAYPCQSVGKKRVPAIDPFECWQVAPGKGRAKIVAVGPVFKVADVASAGVAAVAGRDVYGDFKHRYPLCLFCFNGARVQRRTSITRKCRTAGLAPGAVFQFRELTGWRVGRMVWPINGINPLWGRRNPRIETASRHVSYGYFCARIPGASSRLGREGGEYNTLRGNKPACLSTGFEPPATSAVVESRFGGVVKRYREGLL